MSTGSFSTNILTIKHNFQGIHNMFFLEQQDCHSLGSSGSTVAHEWQIWPQGCSKQFRPPTLQTTDSNELLDITSKPWTIWCGKQRHKWSFILKILGVFFQWQNVNKHFMFYNRQVEKRQPLNEWATGRRSWFHLFWTCPHDWGSENSFIKTLKGGCSRLSILNIRLWSTSNGVAG